MDNKTSKPLPFGTLGIHKVFLLKCYILYLNFLAETLHCVMCEMPASFKKVAVLFVCSFFSFFYFYFQKSAFKDASVCLFIFDCLQFNDENLMKK